ncbi:MAG: hypothetical protein E7543_01080 [Ruminococcaceae bacterium]|nr:hypothetical protein [Oscillospiraceae bacterium]
MLIKIILVGITICLINIFLKKHLSELVLPVEIVFLAFSVSLCVEYIQNVFSGLTEILFRTQYGEEIFTSAVKGTGICLLSKFSSDICEENGNKMIADVIEFAGRILLAVIAAPYIELIMNIAAAFIK